jgi:hypothetical protein
MLWIRICAMLGSNRSWDTGYPNRGILSLLSVPSGKYRNSFFYIRVDMSASFYTIPNSSIILQFDAIQDVSGGKVSSVGGHSIDHSKQKSIYVHVSYHERFPR